MEWTYYKNLIDFVDICCWWSLHLHLPLSGGTCDLSTLKLHGLVLQWPVGELTFKLETHNHVCTLSKLWDQKYSSIDKCIYLIWCSFCCQMFSFKLIKTYWYMYLWHKLIEVYSGMCFFVLKCKFLQFWKSKW